MPGLIKVNTFVSIGFNDCLYFLGYDLQFMQKAKREPADRRALFDECRKARFRFHDRLLYSEAALTDHSYQYGNYHAALMRLEEDFLPVDRQELEQKLDEEINRQLSGACQPVKAPASSLIRANVRLLAAGNGDCFELSDKNALTEAKRVPFATFDFFQSFLIFYGDDPERVVYLEIGAD
ncbi:MAG TPA: hypothetical protein VHK69_16860 [Chitinophagaceae bacterium]|nr:hypothetical protein [Chitinophagaceae bacterium]